MLLSITDKNAWERESWHYIFDISKQDAAALNWLMIFVRLANAEFERVKENAPTVGGGSIFSRPMKMFAASYYTIRFYDKIDEEDDDRLILLEGKTRCHIRKSSGYLSSCNFMDTKISVARMKSAAVTMRDKKENKLYKNFDSIFLKQKQPA